MLKNNQNVELRLGILKVTILLHLVLGVFFIQQVFSIARLAISFLTSSGN